MEKIVYKAVNRFENLIIKSLALKGFFFILMQVFTVRYFSFLFLIPCQLFQGVQIGTQILRKLLIIVTGNQLASFFLMLLTLTVILLISYVAVFKKNELASKTAFIGFMIIQQLSSIFGIIAFSILVKDEIALYLKLLTFLVLLIVQVLALISDRILITYSFETNNMFAHKSNRLLTYCKLGEKILFYSIFIAGSVLRLSSTFGKVYYLALTLIQSIKIKQMIREKFYINEIANCMEIFASIVSTTILLEISLFEVYPIDSLKGNAFVLWLIVSIFASLSVFTYINQRTNEYFLKNVEEIYQNNQVINYLEAFFTLWINCESNYYSLIVASIRKNHQYLCRKTKCYCYMANQIQVQKNNISEGNLFFFRGYFQEILTFIDKQNKNQDEKFLKVLYFKLKIFNNCIKLSKQLHKIKCSLSNNPQLSIGKNILQNYIQSVYENHANSKNESLKVELPMELNQTITKLQKIVFSDIYVKNKKWNNLGKNFCKILDIEDLIQNQIINLRDYDLIYEKYKLPYKKSLSFNALSFFYYADVAFINKKVQAIEANLKELKSPVKYREVISNKQLAKHILDSRCCLLEIDLSSSENVKVTELSVSNCTQNVKEIFKFEKLSLMGRKIETLFPKIMVETQRLFFQKFINPNEEMIITDAIDKYFVDKSGHVFEALINLKIVAQSNSIVLMMVIFQKQTQNIMLLNEKGMIQNIGETFVRYFGRLYQDIPLSSFFYFDEEYNSMNFSEKITKARFIFLNSLELADDWIDYLETIKSYLKKKKTNSLMKLKSLHGSLTYSSESKKGKMVPNEDKETLQFLRKEKRELIRKRILTSREISTIRQTGKSLSSNSFAGSILSVSLDYKIVCYDKLHLKVVIIDEVKKKKSSTDKTQLTIKSLNDIFIKKQGTNYEGTLKDILKSSQKKLLEELQNDDDVLMSVNLEEEIQRKKKEKEMLMHEANSVQSSMRASTVSYFYLNFVDICFNLFKRPSTVVDKRLNTFTVGSIIVALCLSLLVAGSYVFFNLGLFEIKDIFFADGAVSDNMQLTLFMYNRAMNFKQFKDNSEELERIKEAAFFERDYVYGLQVNDLKQFIEDETAMTNTRFYEYIKVPTKWTFMDPQEPPIQLHSNQFLIYYYRLSQSIEQKILNQSKEAQQQVQNALQLMRMNFPELKRINHQNLYLYQQMSDDSISLLNQIVSIMIVCHVALTLIIFFMYYREKIFRRFQLIEAYSIYKIIPQKVVEFITTYYGHYCHQIQNEKQLDKYQNHYDRHSLYLPLDQANELKKNKSLFSQKKPIFTKSIFQMLIIIFFINLGFGLMLLNIQNLFNPIDLMMRKVNSLMDSQNYLIEAYLDLKAKFIIEQNFLNVQEDFFDELLESQMSVQVLFNKISVESLELFSSYDENYKSDFIDILTTNICDLVEKDVQKEQLQNCRNDLKLSYITNGVITGMNFFTRRVRGVIEELKLKYFASNGSYGMKRTVEREYVLDLLKSVDFREIDESMIFMFKMYQATQSRIYESLGQAITNIMDTSYLVVLAEILLVGLAYPLFLAYNYNNQKLELSKLYVSFLLIPTPLARLLKSFSSRVEQILEYDKTL